MRLLEPTSVRLSQREKLLAEHLRRLMGEKSVGSVVRLLVIEEAQRRGLEQPTAEERESRRTA